MDVKVKSKAAWDAYKNFTGVTDEQLQTVREDLATALFVLRQLEPVGGIASDYVRSKLEYVADLQAIRKRDKD